MTANPFPRNRHWELAMYIQMSRSCPSERRGRNICAPSFFRFSEVDFQKELAATAMRKVLIIEDDQIMAIALREGLESEGYEVEIASDGAAGLRLATQRDFDVVILDLMLPEMSGFDVCQKLRNSGDDVPLIMLTARHRRPNCVASGKHRSRSFQAASN